MDTLDQVLKAFEEEQKKRSEHAAKMSQLRDALMNPWRQGIWQLATAMNTRIQKYNIKFDYVNWQAESSNFAVVVGIVRINTGKSFDLLLFELGSDGTVHASVKNSRDYRLRLIGSDPEFPTSAIEEALADYVGFCLRASC